MTAAPSRLESLLYRDRAIVIAALVGLTLLAWVYLGTLTLDMSRGDMSSMGMRTTDTTAMDGPMSVSSQPWTSITFVLMFVMWSVMMVGMMLPSAAPMILIYARVQRQKLPGENPVQRTLFFTLGYVVMWLGFSLIATLSQWGLSEVALLSPMMVNTSGYLAAALFAAAGLYQLTPLKQACLVRCRSPIQFLSICWKQGDLGAVRMGIHHGAYCVGCCWFLMGLLFFGGVMNLLWVAAIAVFVLLEKVVPYGQWLSRIGGVVMIGFSLHLLLAT